jgi:hypothetical protein
MPFVGSQRAPDERERHGRQRAGTDAKREAEDSDVGMLANVGREIAQVLKQRRALRPVQPSVQIRKLAMGLGLVRADYDEAGAAVERNDFALVGI